MRPAVGRVAEIDDHMLQMLLPPSQAPQRRILHRPGHRPVQVAAVAVPVRRLAAAGADGLPQRPQIVLGVQPAQIRRDHIPALALVVDDDAARLRRRTVLLGLGVHPARGHGDEPQEGPGRPVEPHPVFQHAAVPAQRGQYAGQFRFAQQRAHRPVDAVVDHHHLGPGRVGILRREKDPAAGEGRRLRSELIARRAQLVAPDDVGDFPLPVILGRHDVEDFRLRHRPYIAHAVGRIAKQGQEQVARPAQFVHQVGQAQVQPVLRMVPEAIDEAADLARRDRRDAVAHGVIGDDVDDPLGVRIAPPGLQRVTNLGHALAVRPLGPGERRAAPAVHPAPRPIAQIGRNVQPPPQSIKK